MKAQQLHAALLAAGLTLSLPAPARPNLPRTGQREYLKEVRRAFALNLNTSRLNRATRRGLAGQIRFAE